MTGALLELRGLGRQFGGLEALAGVDIAIREREIVGLIGPNGAGKTTLVNLVCGKLRPTAGDIRFQGRSIAGMKPHRLARLGIARTSQIVQPFTEMTALENVMVGALFGRCGARRSTAEARRHAAAILGRVGLARFADVPADALNVPHRKRVELARALATDPLLLLLDEVMAGLTPPEVDELVAVVRAVRADGTTVVCIEHIMRAVLGVSDRIVVLHRGRVIAEGAPEATLRRPGVVAAYLGGRYGETLARSVGMTRHGNSSD